MSTYRTGNHWGVTIVREGGVTDHEWRPFNVAEHLCDTADCMLSKAEHTELVAVVVNGDKALAERICALLNASDKDWAGVISYGAAQFQATLGVDDSCTCTVAGPDPACVVHQGRRARGPKPPNPPGCICDGSGRTCPRHGAVL